VVVICWAGTTDPECQPHRCASLALCRSDRHDAPAGTKHPLQALSAHCTNEKKNQNRLQLQKGNGRKEIEGN